MPLYPTSEEWQRQSSLLLRARPSTTRITTKYHIPNLSSPRVQKKLSSSKTRSKPTSTTTTTSTDDASAAQQAQQPRAYLSLKTYDPASGVCLKYRTDKAAEIGRLIAGLGLLGRDMAALPQLAEEKGKDKDVVMEDVAETSVPAAAAAAVENVVEKAVEKVGGGGKKNKKKGGKR